MLVNTDASSLVLRLRLIDDAGDAITGVAFNDAALEISYMLEAGAAWVTPDLVAGTLGTFAANSWVELGQGVYQYCPPDAAVVAGSHTLVRLTYGANEPLFDMIEARLAPSGGDVDVDEDAVALGVYRRLAGASVAMLRQPTEDDELEAVNSVDFVKTLDIATAADSELVFTVRKCVDDDDAQLEVTLSGGLVTVAGDAWDDAADGSVTRDSATAVTVRVAAAAMSQLRPGIAYACEVREILEGGSVEGRSEFTLHVRRSAGRRIAA